MACQASRGAKGEFYRKQEENDSDTEESGVTISKVSYGHLSRVLRGSEPGRIAEPCHCRECESESERERKETLCGSAAMDRTWSVKKAMSVYRRPHSTRVQ
eukprot:1552494-Rhodomonas_salina.2